MGTVLIFIRFLLNLKDPCGLLRSFRPSPRRPLLDRIRIDVNPEDAGPIRRAPAELEHKDGGAGGGHRLLQCKFLEAHVVLVQLKRPQMREAVGVDLGWDTISISAMEWDDKWEDINWDVVQWTRPWPCAMLIRQI